MNTIQNDSIVPEAEARRIVAGRDDLLIELHGKSQIEDRDLALQRCRDIELPAEEDAAEPTSGGRRFVRRRFVIEHEPIEIRGCHGRQTIVTYSVATIRRRTAVETRRAAERINQPACGFALKGAGDS